MSIKKKMGMGIATGALGLALVGGGSFAAFNDVEALDSNFKAGTLDLTVNDGAERVFDLSNLKPGDHFTEKVVLKNDGSLTFKDIIAEVTFENFKNGKDAPEGGENSAEEFLSQFTVDIKQDGTLVDNNIPLTALQTHSASGYPIASGLSSGQETNFEFTITFENDPDKESGEYVQNVYQGDSVDVVMNFEATQQAGENLTPQNDPVAK
ncbi:TasA family protein [Halobacillus hunanensis]|uniref:TasA family protein n=1 Tax=Halobacillus hunanensis TaxID=578214 RepID=UPI0009A64B77|nr:TasA family protein [Halobacillus hunanensis]